MSLLLTKSHLRDRQHGTAFVAVRYRKLFFINFTNLTYDNHEAPKKSRKRNRQWPKLHIELSFIRYVESDQLGNQTHVTSITFMYTTSVLKMRMEISHKLTTCRFTE